MTRHATIEDVFLAALDRPTPERAAFVQAACAGDPELLARVNELLAAHDEANGPLDTLPIRGPKAEPSPAGTAVGPYRLEGVLGEGGMGTVYRAMHTRLGRPVALKLLTARRRLDSDAGARFEREMRAIGALRHPNIVQPTDAGDIDGVPFLAMELLDGRDLGRLVKERGPLSVADACEAVRQAALGLQHAHEHGLVHRDVKPSNLMLTPEGAIKLLDLGLVRSIGSDCEGPVGDSTVVGTGELTDTHTRVGTANYMAPEQSAAPDKVDSRADVYALGRTLCFLLTGSPELPKANGVPASLIKVLHRLTAERAEDRIESAAAVAAALRPWSREHDVGALLGKKRRRRWRFRHVVVPILAVGVIGVGITLAVNRLSRNQTIEERAFNPPEPPPAGKLGITAEEARTLQKRRADFMGQDIAVRNSIDMDLVLIPPGEVVIKDVTTVIITKPYRLSATEVTRGQFRAFVTATGYRPDSERLGGGVYWYVVTEKGRATGLQRMRSGPQYTWKSPGHEPLSENDPVSQVSWNDAAAFCKWLSEREGKTYRLPTAAEMTWAARAGDGNPYPGVAAGRIDPTRLEQSAWTLQNSPSGTKPVAGLQPNAWGLFDMLGNVSEWCVDNYGATPGGVHVDYAGPERSLVKVHYGGSYVNRYPYASIHAGPPNQRSSAIGFRVLREP